MPQNVRRDVGWQFGFAANLVPSSYWPVDGLAVERDDELCAFAVHSLPALKVRRESRAHTKRRSFLVLRLDLPRG